MSSIEIPELNPGSGTNWSCDVVEDVKLLCRNARYERKQLIQWGNFMQALGYVFAISAFLLATINVYLRSPLISLLIAIFLGLILLIQFNHLALNSFDNAFNVADVIDAARCELLLPVDERIDGVFYLRMIQMDLNAALYDWVVQNIGN
jgi:hypothetical protein